MILSHKHKYIFIHIYKNAGTSITAALVPQSFNFFHYNSIRVLKKLKLKIPERIDPRPFKTHIKAKDVIGFIGQEKFDSYFSFAIVRNPWDWQVSLYNYMLKSKDHFQHEFIKTFSGFDEYIRWRCAEEVRFQKDFIYSEEGELLVDFVGKFENLQEDFNKICAKLSIKTELPKLNVSNSKPYKEFYSSETRELVEKAFEPDISLFGYSF